MKSHPDRPPYELPTIPTDLIGRRIDHSVVTPWVRRKILRYQIKEHVNTLENLRRKGYAARVPGDSAILSKHCKKLIRNIMRIVDQAYEIQIAGIQANAFYGGSANQCFIQDGQSHSGISYWCQLLFRAAIPDQDNP